MMETVRKIVRKPIANSRSPETIGPGLQPVLQSTEVTQNYLKI